MKKLMITAAAALCATVGFSVESQIVGYQSPAISDNVASIGISSFVPVADPSAPNNLMDYKVTAPGVGAGVIQIQTLTSGAATDRTFYWIPEGEAEGYDMTSEGWFDADNWCPVETLEEPVLFDAGAGFLLMNDYGTGATITYCGAVVAGATELPILNRTASVGGNCTPCPFDLTAMTVTAPGVGAGVIQIQTLTPGAATDRTFYWIPEDEAEGYDMTAEGWFDADNWCPVETLEEPVTFAACEGFLLMNDYGEGAKIKLPSPLE